MNNTILILGMLIGAVLQYAIPRAWKPGERGRSPGDAACPPSAGVASDVAGSAARAGALGGVAMMEAQEIIGYVVWDKQLRTIYRGRVYEMLPKAMEVRMGIVWHSRERYEVRGVTLDGIEARQ